MKNAIEFYKNAIQELSQSDFTNMKNDYFWALSDILT